MIPDRANASPHKKASSALACMFGALLAAVAGCTDGPGNTTPLSLDEQLTIFLLSVDRSYPPQVARERGIWLLGGITDGAQLVREVDLFDPVAGVWYPDATELPTPRAYARTAVLDNRFYVMGGIDASGETVATVDVLNPRTVEWSVGTPMPQRLQGFVAGVVGANIYAVGGTTTAAMQSGTLFNQVYRFSDSESGGSWRTFVSGSTIDPNIEMGGCEIDGVLYFFAGRFYSDGSVRFDNDGYTPAANTVTAANEASMTVARYGGASVCYAPAADDPFPLDEPATLYFGGSTLANTSQPPGAILASNVFDYFQPGAVNTTQAGPVLPRALYQAAADIDYDRRRAYVFGGAAAVNVPVQAVYSLDLANPTGAAWQTETASMPRSRYAHSAASLR